MCLHAGFQPILQMMKLGHVLWSPCQLVSDLGLCPIHPTQKSKFLLSLINIGSQRRNGVQLLPWYKARSSRFIFSHFGPRQKSCLAVSVHLQDARERESTQILLTQTHFSFGFKGLAQGRDYFVPGSTGVSVFLSLLFPFVSGLQTSPGPR